MDTPFAHLPVVVVGAGPEGLAAAVHLAAAGTSVLILERGDRAGYAVRQWGHVRMFSPWKYNVDPLARAQLLSHGWAEPSPDELPTGDDLVNGLIEPLSQLPILQGRIQYNARVAGIARRGRDRLSDTGRDGTPYIVRVVDRSGHERDLIARAVIDASGTYLSPRPLGASGLRATGEERHNERIHRGVPDLRGAQRARFAGKTTLVVGSGDSAFNALLALGQLTRERGATRVLWGIRGPAPRFGGGSADQLAARGALGDGVQALVEAGAIEVIPELRIESVSASNGRLRVVGPGVAVPGLDHIVSATGYRPDLEMLRELRTNLHASTESAEALGPLIDPNIHSCGTVPPHGARELGHPESMFYVIGMKSYGRAPTFLLLTGYEQARSVTAAIRGDWSAAMDTRLTLPETGVCSSTGSIGTGTSGDGAVAAAQSCDS